MIDKKLFVPDDINIPPTGQGPLRNLANPNLVSERFGDEEEFTLLDRDWAKNAFFVGGNEYVDGGLVQFSLYRSTADYTWEDTTAGGNIAANPRHQYTRYSDPRRKGILPGRADVTVDAVGLNLGMGRLYNEYLQDASEVTHFRVGIIENTSLLNFLTNYGDPELTSIHVNGRHIQKFSSAAGTAAGAGAAFAFTAWIASPLTALIMAGAAVTAAVVTSGLMDATTDFYTLRPMMHLYWLAVNNFVNSMLLEEGFILQAKGNKSDSSSRRGVDQGTLGLAHELYPHIFTATKGIDTAAIMARSALRWQAAHQKSSDLMKSDSKPNTDVPIGTTVIKEMQLGSDPASSVSPDGVIDALTAGFDALSTSKAITDRDPEHPKNATTEEFHQQTRLTATQLAEIKDSVRKSVYEKVAEEGDVSLIEYGKAEWDLGSAFANLRFDVATGLSDTFTNSTEPSNLAGMLNGAAKASRTVSYEFGGVRNDANAVTDAIKGVANFIGDFGSSMVQGVDKFFLSAPSAVYSILKGAQANIPDHWSESSQNIATVTYTTTIVTTSQHPLARVMDLMLPLGMIIALVASRQVGPAAFTGPFMVSAFTRGKGNVKMGIVESCTIDREVTNQSYDRYGRPMAFRVTLSVKDLTPVAPMLMPSPVPGTSIAEELKMTSGDSVFNRWLRTLSGRSIAEDFFAYERSANRIATAYNITGGRFSKARLAQGMYDSLQANPGFAFGNAVRLNLSDSRPAGLQR